MPNNKNFVVKNGLDVNDDSTINGDLTVTGDVTSTSDERLKENITTIPNALDKVNSIRGVEFDMNKSRHIGVIAQEVETVVPEVVITANDDVGTKSVAYGNIVGLLIEAIKEQNVKIKKLEQEILELKNGI